MNVNDLKELRKEILQIYNNEKALLNKDNSDLMSEELKHINNEISKIDSLIDIYSNNDAKYRVMMLERLYMQTLSEMSKEEFSKISVEDEIDIYDNLFPDAWILSVPFEKKQQYLTEAICSNKPLDQIINVNEKNTAFSKKRNNGVLYEK